MKLAVLALTVLGVLAAGSAALVVQSMKARTVSPLVGIVVAQTDLPAMTRLTADHVKAETVSRAAVPKGSLVNPVQAVGRILNVSLMRGQAVTEASLVARGSLMEKVLALPPGMTVATVTVPSRSVNGGLLYAGCYVHVSATLREGKSSDVKSLSGTLFRAMQVWSMGDEPGGTPATELEPQKTKRQSSGSGMIKVNLLATEEQARILQIVGERGAITLTIRNPREVAESDPQTELVADAGLRKVLGLVPDEPVVSDPLPPAPKDVNEAPPPKPSRIVQVILGPKVKDEVFPPKDGENGRNQ